MALTLRVLAPSGTIWQGSADEVILPSTSGQLGILTNHAPLITALGTGIIRIKTGGNPIAIAIFGGLAEIEANEISILIKQGILGSKVDVEAATAQREQATSILKGEPDASTRLQAQQDLDEAVSMLQAAAVKSATTV